VVAAGAAAQCAHNHTTCQMEEYEALLEKEKAHLEAVADAAQDNGEGDTAASADAGSAAAASTPAAPNFEKLKKRLQRQFRVIPLELQRLFTQLQCLDRVRALGRAFSALVLTSCACCVPHTTCRMVAIHVLLAVPGRLLCRRSA